MIKKMNSGKKRFVLVCVATLGETLRMSITRIVKQNDRQRYNSKTKEEAVNDKKKNPHNNLRGSIGCIGGRVTDRMEYFFCWKSE